MGELTGTFICAWTGTSTGLGMDNMMQPEPSKKVQGEKAQLVQVLAESDNSTEVISLCGLSVKNVRRRWCVLF